MLVFRVQHAEKGTGPYLGSDWPGKWEMRSAHNDDDHPGPWFDVALGGMESCERCGLDTPAALLAWFEGFLHNMAEGGYEVVIIEAEEARIGQYGQVVYPDDAPILDRLPIETFCDLFDNTDPLDIAFAA